MNNYPETHWKLSVIAFLAMMTLYSHKLFLIQAFGKQFKWDLQSNSANLMVEILPLHAWKIYPFNKIDHTGHHSPSPIKTHLIHKQFIKNCLFQMHINILDYLAHLRWATTGHT